MMNQQYAIPTESDEYSAPQKKKVTRKAAPASANKIGKLESFKVKEREREYDRQLKELDLRMTETINVKAKQVL